jgi:hypothetical protein
VAVEDGRALFALPNPFHRDRCEECRVEVEQALAAHFGRPVPLRLVVDAEPTPVGPNPPADEPEVIDLTELTDAPPGGITSPVEHLMKAFEGAQVVEE